MNEHHRSVVALLGDGGTTRALALVYQAARLEGWSLRTLARRQPVVTVADWNRVGLVMLIGHGVADCTALLAALRGRGYDGAFVLLATHVTPMVRRRAFLQGALDVVALPAEPGTVVARLRVALHSRPAAVSPPAPDTPQS